MSSVRSVVRMVAAAFNTPESPVSQAAILSEGRESQAVAHARQVAIFVHHYRNRSTQRATASAFERTPPTVNHAIKSVKKRMRNSKLFRTKVMSIASR